MSTQAKQLANALKHLQAATRSLANVKKRKKASKRKNPCSAKSNPRVHFPKTRRGRKPVTRSWTITQKGKPPIRFKASKLAAFAKAKKLASKSRRLVLDGPK